MKIKEWTTIQAQAEAENWAPSLMAVLTTLRYMSKDKPFTASQLKEKAHGKKSRHGTVKLVLDSAIKLGLVKVVGIVPHRNSHTVVYQRVR